MKCPCCKVINTLNEALKHHSVTSLLAASNAWKSFIETDQTELVLAIYPCVKHGIEGGYTAFMEEANAKRRELIANAKAESERRATESFERMIRDSVERVTGFRFLEHVQ